MTFTSGKWYLRFVLLRVFSDCSIGYEFGSFIRGSTDGRSDSQ
jgi:hypothetical protein